MLKYYKTLGKKVEFNGLYYEKANYKAKYGLYF